MRLELDLAATLALGVPLAEGVAALARFEPVAFDPTMIDRVERIVKLGVFVCSTGDFTDQPKVANGASELMVEVFGEAGKHARSAVGVADQAEKAS